MKLIEAMKKVKANKEKIADLQQKISQYCANLSPETPLYGTETPKMVAGWLQACLDLTQDNVQLLVRIAATNQATPVTIQIGEKSVSKSIAEWVWRRREYAALDQATFAKLGDRGLKEGVFPSSTGGNPMEVKIVRHFDPKLRDAKLDEFRAEPGLIDSTLEVVNAVTELI